MSHETRTDLDTRILDNDRVKCMVCHNIMPLKSYKFHLENKHNGRIATRSTRRRNRRRISVSRRSRRVRRIVKIGSPKIIPTNPMKAEREYAKSERAEENPPSIIEKMENFRPMLPDIIVVSETECSIEENERFIKLRNDAAPVQPDNLMIDGSVQTDPLNELRNKNDKYFNAIYVDDNQLNQLMKSGRIQAKNGKMFLCDV